MLRPLSLLALLAAAACQAPPASADDPWQPARFLTGCWRADDGSMRFEEVWTGPHGNTMYGQSRTLDGGEQRFFELLRIELRGDELVYIAQPNGGTPTEFAMAAAADDDITFTNPQHDFPRRIRYWLDDDGVLHAIVDGGEGGGKRIEFAWRPVR